MAEDLVQETYLRLWRHGPDKRETITMPLRQLTPAAVVRQAPTAE